MIGAGTMRKSPLAFSVSYLCRSGVGLCEKRSPADTRKGRPHTTGIYPCPKCGIEGPLNIEIRKGPSLKRARDSMAHNETARSCVITPLRCDCRSSPRRYQLLTNGQYC
jgi:hypothetical protein